MSGPGTPPVVKGVRPLSGILRALSVWSNTYTQPSVVVDWQNHPVLSHGITSSEGIPAYMDLSRWSRRTEFLWVDRPRINPGQHLLNLALCPQLAFPTWASQLGQHTQDARRPQGAPTPGSRSTLHLHPCTTVKVLVGLCWPAPDINWPPCLPVMSPSRCQSLQSCKLVE